MLVACCMLWRDCRFMLVEVIGGFLSGSLALLADAGHMLTDTAALLFALLAVQFSRRPPTIRHTSVG